MFTKFGDSTESLSIEKTANTCPRCLNQLIMVNGQATCDCSAHKQFIKAREILEQNITQDAESTTADGKDNV